MSSLLRDAYYPFLEGVGARVAPLAPPIDQLLTSVAYREIRSRARNRVRAALGDKVIQTPTMIREEQALQELLGLVVAKMLLACIGDRVLIDRYANKEASRVTRILRTKPQPGEDRITDEDVQELLNDTNWPIERAFEGWSMVVPTYLEIAPNKGPCKLILQPVEKGRVQISRRRVEDLIEALYAKKIREELFAELQRGVPGDLRAMLEDDLENLKEELDEARKTWTSGDFGAVQDGAFPPCIRQLFEDMKAGAMIPHHGRFAFASFLGTIGMSADQILDYMSQIPNFSRSKSEYQIRHITGEGSVDAYTPPGCGFLQTNGICPLAQRDEICGTIKHPLSYYRKRKRQLGEDVEDLTKKKPEAAA